MNPAKILKRIDKEIQKLSECKDIEFKYFPEEKERPLYVRFKVEDGVYKGQVHVIKMKLFDKQRQYPISPPPMYLMSQIYHPNYSRHGTICLDMIYDDRNKWLISYSIECVIRTLIALMDDPECKFDHYNSAAAAHWRDYKRKELSLTEFQKIANLQYRPFPKAAIIFDDKKDDLSDNLEKKLNMD